MNTKKSNGSKPTKTKPKAHPMPRKAGISKNRGYSNGGKLCK